MLYRVRFQLSYGGFYYSETFTDIRDAKNLRTDILTANNAGGGIRFFGIEGSDDGGETWEPYQVGQTAEERDEANAACSPGCFDDCDGSDEDSHVPAGIYDPSLPY